MTAWHKFRAKRTDCPRCGSHPSKHEARVCNDLHMLQRAGELCDLVPQARYPLFGFGGVPIMSGATARGRGQQVVMTWDFQYTDAGGQVVHDAKGVETTEFKLRRAVFEACYPAIRTVTS